MNKIKIQYQKIADLKPYENNPRKNKKAVPIVVESIKQFGFLVPVLVDKDNVVVAGHTRIEAAKSLEMKEIPTILVTDLTKAQINAFRIMDNKSIEYSKWDQDLLKREIEALQGKINLDFTGFREAEIKRILNPPAKDAKGNIKGKYKIVKGMVYKLGEHRLICADSRKEQTYLELIGDEDIHLIYTDPPYGVSYSGINNPNGRDWEVIEGDNLRGDELYELLKDCFKQINQFLIKDGGGYVFHASSNQIIFEKALNEAGLKVKQQLIWHKHHILGHSHYHWTHEPIFYICRMKENPKFYGNRDNKTFISELKFDEMSEKELRDYLKEIQKISSVIQIKKDASKDYIHPTQKPVKMAETFIVNSTRKGENVLDTFTGSGSTLIACENRGRKCFAVEIDENFCSHIIERWENLTGKKATDKDGKGLKLS